MSIPEGQLDTWSNQGAVTTAKRTHESVRSALQSAETLSDKNFEVYLQGSYKNSTNIYADSDVDIVAQLNGTFYKDLSALSRDEKELYNARYSSATYSWSDFHSDVTSALREYYGWDAVTVGNKAITVEPSSNRLEADLVACCQYRRYRHFGMSSEDYIEGIYFRTQTDNRKVVNYPKQHYDNGVAKNSDGRTGGWYKPTVRMMKNARSYLVQQGDLLEGICPSYFLECLLYNVPDANFGPTHRDTYSQVIETLGSSQLGDCVSQNGVVELFGNAPEQWSTEAARETVECLDRLWENW